MFPGRRSQTDLRPIPHREEARLIEVLELDARENAYLLGLLRDYTLRGLHRMGWGDFFMIDEPYPQVFYRDVTGLVVLGRAEVETLSRIAEFLDRSKIAPTRIISRAETVLELHRRMMDLSPRWGRIRAEFPESGMALEREALAAESEPALRMARIEEAEAVAAGSVRAMNEEIGIDSSEREFARLVRSKADLIERNRYYVVEEDGEILFQAYLSARLPQAAQVQGVWVPPEHRNRGLATRCLAEMCRRCFESSDSIVLRVQNRNLPAVRVYEKVGFSHFLDYRSIWFA